MWFHAYTCWSQLDATMSGSPSWSMSPIAGVAKNPELAVTCRSPAPLPRHTKMSPPVLDATMSSTPFKSQSTSAGLPWTACGPTQRHGLPSTAPASE